MMSTNDEIPSELFEYSATSGKKNTDLSIIKIVLFLLAARRKETCNFILYLQMDKTKVYFYAKWHEMQIMFLPICKLHQSL